MIINDMAKPTETELLIAEIERLTKNRSELIAAYEDLVSLLGAEIQETAPLAFQAMNGKWKSRRVHAGFAARERVDRLK
jgi:hypothetical protein